jgi:CRP/FNR family transcriptional regulator, anaerobic regulatory protein
MAATALRDLPAPAPRAGLRSIRQLKSCYSDAAMRELSVGLEPDTVRQLDAMAANSAWLPKGDALYRPGKPFTALYAIRVGSCKTSALAADGREQVTGYHMLGDIIGLDGIGTERHGCQAIALEDSMVSAIPFEGLEKLARASATLQHNLHQFLSRDIGRDQGMMLLLGTMVVEERIAVFLLNLSERYRQRGYSSTEFVLRMTRQEIGSYLGMKLETVSRVFSRLQEHGLVRVRGRAVKLLDFPALMRLAGRRD